MNFAKSTLYATSLAFTLFGQIALAAPVSYDFTGYIDSGHYVDETFSGAFTTVDVDSLTGVDDEFLDLASFSFTFLGQNFSLADADASPAAHYYDGEFLGLDLLILTFDPWFGFVSGFFALDEAYFAYQPSQGDAGYGTVTYRDVQASVPEPGTLALLMAGLGLAAWSRRRPG
ncbi:MAG: PEP-CTERM sorting domain-containing protein [Pseudomonadota bacterium]